MKIDNLFSSETIVQIGRGLAKNSTLKNLILSKNGADDDAMTSFFTYIKDNQCLEQLSIPGSHHKMPEEQNWLFSTSEVRPLPALFQFLEQNKSITSFICSTRLEDDTAKKIFEAIQKNPKITTLDIRGTHGPLVFCQIYMIGANSNTYANYLGEILDPATLVALINPTNLRLVKYSGSLPLSHIRI